MNGRPETSDVELHAYVDGALDAECAQAFAARIESDPCLPRASRPIARTWLC